MESDGDMEFQSRGLLSKKEKRVEKPDSVRYKNVYSEMSHQAI